MKLKPVRSRRSITLGDGHARITGKGIKRGTALASATTKEVDRIAERQRLLYADGRHALLIVLQGRDASGKDGTIRKVFSAVNPQGCTVTAFKAPTDLEQRHDFLWRIHQAVPALGMIGIFNRSHYEDVLVPRVHGDIGRKEAGRRLDQINDFERMLGEHGVSIVKFMLHVSRDEQKRRLQERIDDPTKHWKFRAEDLDDRARWPEFTDAYHDILEQTSTRHAPWYIVPADDKDVRDWLIARTIADALASMDLRFPSADVDAVQVE
jgi:PPK2 family polyphosphate:nucleotide phosphotransferase